MLIIINATIPNDTSTIITRTTVDFYPTSITKTITTTSTNICSISQTTTTYLNMSTISTIVGNSSSIATIICSKAISITRFIGKINIITSWTRINITGGLRITFQLSCKVGIIVWCKNISTGYMWFFIVIIPIIPFTSYIKSNSFYRNSIKINPIMLRRTTIFVVN